MNTHKMTRIAIIVACLALAGCASTGAVTPTATQPPITQAATIAPAEAGGALVTSSPTSTLSPALEPTGTRRPTRTPKPSLTPTPPDTPIPTATSYPAPAVPLSPAGPWLVFRVGDYWSGYYLWAINQDGTGLTRLTNEPASAFTIRPGSSAQNGLTVAYVSRYGKGAIRILSWPAGNVKTIVYQNVSDRYEWGYGLQDAYQNRGLVWSSSGSKLAFVSAMDDTNLNVFVYDGATDQIARVAVTDVDSDFRLLWSADERCVIFQSFYSHVMTGGPVTTGLWSAQTDASGVTQLVGGIEGQGQYVRDIEYLGWASPKEIVVTFEQWKLLDEPDGRDRVIWVSNREVRVINIETGNTTTIASEPLLDVAYSPEHNLFLMTKDATPSPNRLLVFYQNGEMREVAGYTIKYVEWLDRYGVFLGQTPDGRIFLISPDGTVVEVPTHKWDTYDDKSINSHSVIVSPDHQWWAQYHSRYLTNSSASELWIGPAKAPPSVRLSTSLGTGPNDGLVSDSNIIWSPDSQHLLWLSGGRLFVANAPNFEAAMVAELPTGSYLYTAVWVH